MLPLQQSYEVKYSIIEYLKATFNLKEKAVNEALYQFITDKKQGIFKGPYISIKLPFVTADAAKEIPLEIRPAFPPYDHQCKSFERLTSENGHLPQSTLITTGTSSGKTECFLYPVLDYCYKHINRLGVKVIILYPMNALATDQAKRLAEAIWADDRLKGKITAGLFIGEGKDKKKYPQGMGEHHIIENKQSILDSPPDILLTNFKMLDYALMRHNYQNIWYYNQKDSSLLQYLVLDELHTYDGAQGTDVANLLRRLKLKLNIPKGQLCAVGTSATMGTKEESQQLLIEYAQKIFGEEFNENAIIRENRVSVDAFFESSKESIERYKPNLRGIRESRLKENETYENYLNSQKRLWLFPENISSTELGEGLKMFYLVRDLILLTSQQMLDLDTLLVELAKINTELNELPEWDNIGNFNPREEVLSSLLALMSEAKVGISKPFPFVYLQVQIWIRELRGLLREVGSTPIFTWKDKLSKKEDTKALPAYYCRECGASGWLGVKDDNKNHFFSDINQVYEHFFSNHKNLYFINTAENKHIEEYEPNSTIDAHLGLDNFELYSKKNEHTLKIHAVRKLRKENESKARHICPECNTENTLGIIGTRVATLSSITVSQVLASDLDERGEKYRKILAFTNSVQDAAHQAGFVEARNYRFTFRASLQKVINASKNVLTIEALQAAFVAYWKSNSDETGANNEQAYYYRFFPADYKAKADIEHDYRIGTQFTDEFKQEFDTRMKWELVSEFGFNAIIGRTLEKTGASAAKFDGIKLKEIYHALEMWLQQNNLAVIKEEIFVPFVNGILHRVRTRGGIDHEYLRKFRQEGLQLWNLNWMQDNRHFLNRYFGTRTRLPKLLTTAAHSRAILDTTYTQTNNWYRAYFIKSFPYATHYHNIVNDFYTQLFELFVQFGIMNKMGKGEDENYALLPNAIQVENKVMQYVCSACGSTLNVAASDEMIAQTKCLNYTCKTGVYMPSPNKKPNYYQLVYNRNRAPRIYAAEHTGVLERKEREKLEISFKERPSFNSHNTIVATSTLEMGIDIGTLNSAINNAVPPLTANFLQRVGRAGRSSGAALITNFAQGKAHDLFYYEEPLDMMEGEINTPGCYLEAKDILYRHFFAYCLDNWASADAQNNAIPRAVYNLRLMTTDLSDSSFLANRIIAYIKANEDNLVNRFIDFYKPDLSETKVLDNLRLFLMENSFYENIKNVFVKLKKEYLSIQEKRQEIDTIIKVNRLAETDLERKTLEGERKALWGLKRLIDKRSIVQHLTNVGLLPNYAFPETGVTLNAWIKSNKAKASSNLPSDKQFEIVRASSVAIREFAPDNYFYGQGFKFAISGLNTFDWKDAGVLLRKRFCSNCDHIADSAVSTENYCPKCGDASWSEAKNQHIFVKMNGVKSVNTREKSTLDDSSDDRQEKHYKISKHLKFDASSFQGAWGMKDIPFGIEYVKNVDITEVNLGLSSASNANKITINQLENVPCHGFVSCKYCGKSTSEPHKGLNEKDKEFKWHFGYCKNKDKKYEGKSDACFEEVYLFREMKTEALKVLLPVQDLASEAHINMFKAGLELGLKKYYKGNPQHISMINYSEYNTHNSRFDRYLVLYDNIPGGTGYLEKLFNTVEFTKVITEAYYAIKSCACQANDKDGCYRCIYTYSNQAIQGELSRRKAESLFKKIVEKSDLWEKYPSGLGSLTESGQIEESELEERFIRSIKNHAKKKQPQGFHFESFMENAVMNYKLKVVNENNTFCYVIRPQIELGASEGVRYNTRCDFYISLSAIERNGFSGEEEASLTTSVKDIAVYLDGYTYHATEGNNRFVNDLQKRLAIVESGDKISWTLTWQDMEIFDYPDNELDANDKKRDSLFMEINQYRKTIQVYDKIPHFAAYKEHTNNFDNSLQRLLWWLENPLSEQNAIKKIALKLSYCQEKFGNPSIDAAQIEGALKLSSSFWKTSFDTTDKSKGNFYVFPRFSAAETDFAYLLMGIKLSDLSLKASIRLSGISGNLEKSKWESFWQLFNLVQSNCQLLKEETTFSFMEHIDFQEEGDKYSCLAYQDESVHEIVKQLIDRNIPFNKEGGFFIEPQKGCYAEAIFGLEAQKIVISPLSDADRKIFAEAGYTEIQASHFNIQHII